MMDAIAENINILGKFCGKRDISALTSEALSQVCGLKQVDVMVLFGGSILCGGDVFAAGIKNKIAKTYIIVGGAGHTTEKLREKMHTLFPAMDTYGRSEAELFSAYIRNKYGIDADYLECNSTNCGNNITFLLELLKEKQINAHSYILVQDATMQHRMDACLRKYISDDTLILNYAAYEAEVIVKNDSLYYKNDIFGMWDMEQYITLLMGEIKRLTDDADGYGPLGKNFIAHVEVTEEASDAFAFLRKEYEHKIRKANPCYENPFT